MKKNVWLILIMFLLVPGMLFMVSCAKKNVKTDVASDKQAEEEATMKARDAERARQEELARQRAMEEERLREESKHKEEMRMETAAQNRFLNEDIHFEFDSFILVSEAQEVLKWKAEWLRNNPDVQVIIEGHCDERGTNQYNLALGERRATSAKSFLVDFGISASRLTTISYGEERPLYQEHNEEAWAKNRRAHFIIK